MTTQITVRVDPDKCQGHARCNALAPELFQLDEFGHAGEGLLVLPSPTKSRKLTSPGQLSGGCHRPH